MLTALRKNWPALYLILGVIWGGSFFFTKISFQSLSPVGVVFWRLAIGALALYIYAKFRGTKLPKKWKPWLVAGIGGVFMNALPFVLFAYAQTKVTSILASIINGATPIMTLLAILLFFRNEKLRPNVVLGLLIGMAGLFVVLAVWQGFGDNDPVAVLSMVAAICCYGIGGPFIKRYVHPLGLRHEITALAQVGGAALAVLPLYVAGPLLIAPLNIQVVLSILALGAVGSGLAYVLYYIIIAVAGSAIANSVTYLTPLVAIALGVLFLNEELHWYEPVGGAIVILGALISQGRITRKKQAPSSLP